MRRGESSEKKDRYSIRRDKPGRERQHCVPNAKLEGRPGKGSSFQSGIGPAYTLEKEFFVRALLTWSSQTKVRIVRQTCASKSAM